MQKKYLWLFGALVIIIGIVFLTNTGENKGQTPTELPKLSVGIQTSPAMALVMVAEDKGYDKKNGVDVEIKEFTAGKFALQAFFGGSLDVAVSGDVPVALSTLQGNKTLVVGQVVERTVNEVRVVARKDETVGDAKAYFTVKKRKLGTSFGGGPEFFTYEFLNDLGIGKDQIEILSQTPADMPAALFSGSVDAISIFDPFAYKAEKLLGDKAVTFKNPNIYSELYVINVQPSVKENSEQQKEIVSFLKALIEAEKFTTQNPEEAKAIVMKYTKLDKETVDSILGSFGFRVALTPQLLEFWNREALWAKATDKVKKEVVTPNFREIIFDEQLRKIDAKRVGL